MSDDNGNAPLDDQFRKPRRRRKQALQTDGSTQRAEHAFKEGFAAKCRAMKWVLPDGAPIPVDWNYGRDRKLLKVLIDIYGESTVIETLIPEFFALDARYFRGDWKVPTMRAMAQRLLMERGRRKLHPRTAENVLEAQKALEKRK